MVKYLFAFILLIHGLIHFTGFAKAYNFGNITQLTRDISKPNGLLWLLTAILFVVATLLFVIKKESWSYIAIVTAVISQTLIIAVWKDAKFGSILNFIILFVAIASWANYHFEKEFKADVKKAYRENRFFH